MWPIIVIIVWVIHVEQLSMLLNPCNRIEYLRKFFSHHYITWSDVFVGTTNPGWNRTWINTRSETQTVATTFFLIFLVELYMAMGCEQRRCHISTPSTWALPSSTPEFICLHWFESGFGQKVQRWYGSGSYRSRYMEYGATIQHFSTLAHTCPAYAQMETVKPVNWPNMKKMEI